MAAAERASPSSESSHSHSGMADNENEAERFHQSEISAEHSDQPPKKKRTRTLTTPHQSAVLHALLAKSRFPTTAMREEVGRQIGLSARKVQIWFQNQRQKARRPQGSEGGEATPLSRPTQSSSGMASASLPNTGISAPSTSPAFAPQGAVISPSVSHSQPPPSLLSVEAFPEAGPSGSRGSLDSSGVLGTRWKNASSPPYQHRRLTSAPEWETSSPASTSPQGTVLDLHSRSSHPSHSQSSRTIHISQSVREPIGRGSTPRLATPRIPVIVATPLNVATTALTMKQFLQQEDAEEGGASLLSQHTGGALPPINTSAWNSQQHQRQRQQHPNHGSSAATGDPYTPGSRPFPPPVESASSPSQLHRGAQGTGDGSGTETGLGATLTNIPAPFTLQPQPQWDPRTFAPTCKPDFSVWTRGPSSPGSSSYHPRPVTQSFSSFGVFGTSSTGDVSSGERRSMSPGPVPSPVITRSIGLNRAMHQHSYSTGAPSSATSTSIIGGERQHGRFRAMTPPSHTRTYRHASPDGRRGQ
ncbi:hypothetical protein V8B97DRAFT_1874631 [Scleroderma yunnanense]